MEDIDGVLVTTNTPSKSRFRAGGAKTTPPTTDFLNTSKVVVIRDDSLNVGVCPMSASVKAETRQLRKAITRQRRKAVTP